MGMPVTVTLSSVGVSPPVACNWLGGSPISVGVTASASTMTASFNVQFTLDDLQLSSSPKWMGLSSAFGSSATTFSASAVNFADNGFYTTFQGPIGAVRLNASTISSGTLTLKVNQGEGW